MTMVLSIIGIIIFIACIIAIFIIIKNDKINNVIYKINMCEKEIGENLNHKEDLVLRVISIINRKLNLDIKEFEDVKNIKSNKVNDIDRDKILAIAYEKIGKIYLDNNDLGKVKSFDGLLLDIDKNEIELISLRTLYNKTTVEYNSIRKKFFNKILCKFRHLESKNLYEGKELQNVIEKELNNLVI